MKLMEYLPEKYGHSPETVAFQEALQPEVDMLWAARSSILLQLSPRTAEGWGLRLWEVAMGLKPLAGVGLDERRGRVIARIRGVGVVDVPLLKAVVESFLVSGVDVTDRPRDNRVDIQYSTAGILPAPDSGEIAAAILEILPAHLGLSLCTVSAPMSATACLSTDATSGSETELPEWRKDYGFMQAIKIAGGFSAASVTELPPAE